MRTAIEGIFRLVLTTIALPSWGMDLSAAVKQAMESSPRVAIARSKVTAADWGRTEAFGRFLPSLEVGATYLSDYRYALTDLTFGGNPSSIPQILPTTTYNLTARYMLFEGFAGWNKVRSSRSMRSASALELDRARFEVEHEVELQFYKVIAARALKTVAEQNLKSLEDHLREARLLRKAGATNDYDLLRVEVQVSQAQSDLLNAEDNIAIESGHLAEVLGRGEPVDAVEGQLPTLDPQLTDGVGTDHLADRADLQAAGDREEGLRYASLAAQSYWSPRLSAFWNYQSYNNRNDRYNDWKNFRDAYTVGLSLTWTLFDGFSSISQAHQAEEMRFQMGKTGQMQRLKARQDFQTWQRKFRYNCAVHRARLTEVSKAEEAVRLAKEGRRVGARTNTDLLDAETDLFRARAGSVTAQLGAVEALLNFELASGRRLLPAQE